MKRGKCIEQYYLLIVKRYGVLISQYNYYVAYNTWLQGPF
jgi:hypothetical protein